MALIKSFRGIVSLAFQVRKLVQELHEIRTLYEADLRSRGVEVLDPGRVGSRDSQTEILYEAKPSDPSPEDLPESFGSWLSREG